MKISALILSGLAILFVLTAGQVFSQEEAEIFEESELAPAVQAQAQEWVLGDVVALDADENQLTLNYIDYDAYEDKKIIVNVDAATTYENVDSLQGIEVGDVVSVDYLIDSDGEATALNICLEKFDEGEGVSASE